MNKYLFVLDCILWVVLGSTLGLSGVSLFSIAGALVWALLLLAICVVHAVRAINAYRRGRLDGAQAVIEKILREGWLRK